MNLQGGKLDYSCHILSNSAKMNMKLWQVQSKANNFYIFLHVGLNAAL